MGLEFLLGNMAYKFILFAMSLLVVVPVIYWAVRFLREEPSYSTGKIEGKEFLSRIFRPIGIFVFVVGSFLVSFVLPHIIVTTKTSTVHERDRMVFERDKEVNIHTDKQAAAERKEAARKKKEHEREEFRKAMERQKRESNKFYRELF